ncbi:MAG: hypothetical protein HEQ23_15065 [Tepidisphaera sp.]
MNPFVLAVILVRVVGVWITVSNVPTLLGTVAHLSGGESRASYSDNFALAALELLMYPFVGIAIGLMCVLKATWFAQIVARGLYPAGHCQRCGYDLASAGATTCPGCGRFEAKAS